MYVSPNFKTKKEFKQALEDGEPMFLYQPGFGDVPENGIVYVEGPHFPEPHRWYAQVTVVGGEIKRIK